MPAVSVAKFPIRRFSKPKMHAGSGGNRPFMAHGIHLKTAGTADNKPIMDGHGTDGTLLAKSRTTLFRRFPRIATTHYIIS